MKVLAILLTVVAVALAQDTHFCPDNWELHVRIFLIKCHQHGIVYILRVEHFATLTNFAQFKFLLYLTPFLYNLASKNALVLHKQFLA